MYEVVLIHERWARRPEDGCPVTVGGLTFGFWNDDVNIRVLEVDSLEDIPEDILKDPRFDVREVAYGEDRQDRGLNPSVMSPPEGWEPEKPKKQAKPKKQKPEKAEEPEPDAPVAEED